MADIGSDRPTGWRTQRQTYGGGRSDRIKISPPCILFVGDLSSIERLSCYLVYLRSADTCKYLKPRPTFCDVGYSVIPRETSLTPVNGHNQSDYHIILNFKHIPWVNKETQFQIYLDSSTRILRRNSRAV